jgi:hypothetical protein
MTHTFLCMTDLDYITLEMGTTATKLTSYQILKNNEICLTNKAGFNKTDISHFSP